MPTHGIEFDKLVKSRINKYYVLGLFYQKQNNKIITPLRCALHNATVQNIHKIYNNNLFCRKDTINNDYTDTEIKPHYREKKEINSKYLYTEDIWFEDEFEDEYPVESNLDNLCFINDNDYFSDNLKP